MKELTDFELLRSGIANNREAFDVLFTRHHEKVRKLALRVCRNDADADDAVQDAFITIFSKAHTFKFQCQFTSWMFRIVYNAALMKLRVNKRKSAMSLEAIPEQDVDTNLQQKSDFKDIEHMSTRHELRDVLQRTINNLPENYRTILILRDVDGLSNIEIMDKLALREGQTKAQIYRARQLVREELQKYLDA